MKLIFSIEYRTRWGEEVLLHIGERCFALAYADGGNWSGEVELDDPGREIEYCYAVTEQGSCVRREWRTHRLPLPAGRCDAVVRVRDRWIDRTDEAPFYSSAFVQGIFGRGEAAANAAPRHDGGNVDLRVSLPVLRPDETLALAGSAPELGAWRQIIPFDDREFPVWNLRLQVEHPFHYKLVVAERGSLRPLRWEEGGDRYWATVPAPGERLVEASLEPRFAACRWRGAGTAVPLFSLRSAAGFGVGEFLDVKLLVDWAVRTGQRILQLLPVNDTTMTGTWEDSYPYNANSSFALHPQFLRLTEVGVEEDAAYCRLRDELNALPEVDYERVNAAKERLLREAYERMGRRVAATRAYRDFVAANREWLIPYAAFRSLRDEFGTADSSCWGDYARYDAARIERYCRTHAREVNYHCFVQYHLHRQFSEVADYARSRGVVLKGDLPIGVSRTSADAWQHPHLFHLDSQAGAPPDAFAANGQNWGFPTYDWERMAEEGYAWWRARLKKMAEYFDAFRIDHILGFFRIWEIPYHAVRGLQGHFSPALPYSSEELRGMGFEMEGDRYTVPQCDAWMIGELFGDLAGEVRDCYLCEDRPAPGYATQRQVVEHLTGDDERTVRLREGLLTMLDDVLFVEDPRRKGFYHPRIAAHGTYAYRRLDAALRNAFDRLYDDFFYRRHNAFWEASALRKLPALLDASGMLACGEDLGMIPDSVPGTMRALRILSLEVQRMPKTSVETFARPERYPYLSVCTTSTHDMAPLRAWWEEDRTLSARFYREVLHGEGDMPWFCEPWLCGRIVDMHLASPSMCCILPLQDWLATDGGLRSADPLRERINVPAIPRYYWRYRMHLTLEELIGAERFNESLRERIARGGRL